MRKDEDNVKKDITKKNAKKKIEDGLRKATTDENANRESEDRLKKNDSWANAKAVASNPKSQPAMGPDPSTSTGGVGIHSGRYYLQPEQQEYAAAARVYPGASAGYQGCRNEGSHRYQ